MTEPDTEMFPAGLTPGDLWLDRWGQIVYRVESEDFQPPEGHEPAGEGQFIARPGASLQDLNGADIELVEGSLRHESYNAELVAEMAATHTIEEISKDRELAHYAYEAIREAGKGPFLATASDGEIFVYDGGVWRGHPHGEERLRELAGQALGPYSSVNVLRELESKVRERATVHRSALGRPPGTVGTPDGLLELESRDLRDLRPKDYVLNRITVAPDPEAPIEDSRWWSFIEEAVPDGQDRAKLQEYAGYCLLPGQPYKKALFLVGPTNSGKGTFLKAIESVLGTANVSHQPLDRLVNSRWGTDKLYGRMANVANEVSPGAIKRIERFKELTGGEDTVTAERKGQPTYEFTVRQKFAFATNQFPQVPHADDAFFARCLFVEFPNSVDEPDTNLLDDLREERATILNWMLDGLTRLSANGGFSGERSLDDRRALTRSFGSPVEQFVYELLDVTGHPDDIIHQGDLYNAFTRFCHFKEFSDTPVKQSFTKDLTKRPGVSTGQSHRVDDGDEDRPRVYQGVRPIEEAFKRIQADIPSYATEDGDDPAAGGQSRLD